MSIFAWWHGRRGYNTKVTNNDTGGRGCKICHFQSDLVLGWPLICLRYVFFINPAIKRFIITFILNIQFVNFFLCYFFIIISAWFTFCNSLPKIAPTVFHFHRLFTTFFHRTVFLTILITTSFSGKLVVQLFAKMILYFVILTWSPASNLEYLLNFVHQNQYMWLTLHEASF